MHEPPGACKRRRDVVWRLHQAFPASLATPNDPHEANRAHPSRITSTRPANIPTSDAGACPVRPLSPSTMRRKRHSHVSVPRTTSAGRRAIRPGSCGAKRGGRLPGADFADRFASAPHRMDQDGRPSGKEGSNGSCISLPRHLSRLWSACGSRAVSGGFHHTEGVMENFIGVNTPNGHGKSDRARPGYGYRSRARWLHVAPSGHPAQTKSLPASRASAPRSGITTLRIPSSPMTLSRFNAVICRLTVSNVKPR